MAAFAAGSATAVAPGDHLSLERVVRALLLARPRLEVLLPDAARVGRRHPGAGAADPRPVRVVGARTRLVIHSNAREHQSASLSIGRRCRHNWRSVEGDDNARI